MSWPERMDLGSRDLISLSTRARITFRHTVVEFLFADLFENYDFFFVVVLVGGCLGAEQGLAGGQPAGPSTAV